MNAKATLQETRLEVEELTCKTCVRKVCEALKALDGVVAVHVQDSPERFDGPADRTVISTVFVRYQAGDVCPDDLAKAVSAAGYHVLAT